MKILHRLPVRMAGALFGAAALVAFATGAARADCDAGDGNVAHGDEIYNETCVACHGENGKGAVPGAPDFTAKGGALSKPHEVMSKHIKEGFREPGKPLAMPPMGGNPDLTDEDIDDVHAYLHDHFGCG